MFSIGDHFFVLFLFFFSFWLALTFLGLWFQLWHQVCEGFASLFFIVPFLQFLILLLLGVTSFFFLTSTLTIFHGSFIKVMDLQNSKFLIWWGPRAFK
jgi:hypothetical protein